MKNQTRSWKILLWTGLFFGLLMSTCKLFDSNGENGENDYEPAPLTDIDSNEYQTVKLWEHIWMAENLRPTRYNDGTPIITGLNREEWESSSEGAYAIYPHQDVEGIDSDQDMVNAYGILYNWQATRDPRGLCPEGWRIPEFDEYQDMRDFVNDKRQAGFDGIGDALKAARQVGHPWGGVHDTDVHPRWGANENHFGRDEFDFTAYAAGFRTSHDYRQYEGDYRALGYEAVWWSSRESATDAFVFRIWSWENFTILNTASKKDGVSVRCIRDAR